MKEEVEVWLARDRDNTLCLYKREPIKVEYVGHWDDLDYMENILNLDSNLFPNIKWEDNEPTKAKIILNK